MYDENKMPLTPDPAAPAPEQEPDEVVSWYVRPDEGQEITGCYVQPGPMPAAAAPKAVRQEKRRSRKGLWTFLVILAVLVGVVLGVAIVSALRGGNSDGYGGDFDDGDHDASSIVDIFQSDVPTIPRADTDPDLRFYCEKAGEEKLTIQQVYHDRIKFDASYPEAHLLIKCSRPAIALNKIQFHLQYIRIAFCYFYHFPEHSRSDPLIPEFTQQTDCHICPVSGFRAFIPPDHAISGNFSICFTNQQRMCIRQIAAIYEINLLLDGPGLTFFRCPQ